MCVARETIITIIIIINHRNHVTCSSDLAVLARSIPSLSGLSPTVNCCCSPVFSGAGARLDSTVWSHVWRGRPTPSMWGQFQSVGDEFRQACRARLGPVYRLARTVLPEDLRRLVRTVSDGCWVYTSSLVMRACRNYRTEGPRFFMRTGSSRQYSDGRKGRYSTMQCRRWQRLYKRVTTTAAMFEEVIHRPCSRPWCGR